MSETITTSKNSRETTKLIVICALFAGLTTVMAQLMVPVGAVPFSLATFAVYMAGGLLGAKKAAISQTVYVLLGCVGIPVFAGFTGGLPIVVGPTGGYIVGYVFMALIVGFVCQKGKNKFGWNVLAMVLGTIVLYAFGTAWFMFETKTAFLPSLMMCVVPFLIGDSIKIFSAAFLSNRLKKVIKI
ncbi:MAG: biotin transporter BioY [Oscillospiraceae bacterium]